MKAVDIQGIQWFLKDEGFVVAVRELTEPTNARRVYGILLSGDRKIFVKYFLEKGILAFIRNRIDPRGRREFQTGETLLSLGIPTPEPLGYGLGRGGSFILQEWIDGQPLWSPVSDPARRPVLLHDIARLLRQLREHGVRHNDLHLGNILATSEGLYLIDLHKTRIKKGSFSRSDEVINLAHVLGPIYYEMTEKEKLHFFGVYGGPQIRPSLEKKLVVEQVRWFERKKARAFSTTSKLTSAGRRVYVKGAEGTGEGAFVECIKNDRKVRVERHTDHIRKIYRDNRRLKRAWRNHVVLEYIELTVVPRTYLVQKGGMFSGGGFIAMEDLKGKGEELDRFLDGNYDGMEESRIRSFIETLSQFMAILLKKRVLHRDLKACNVFVLENGFRLLDVEDLVFRRFNEDDVKRLLIQLNTSVPVRIASSRRARFFSRFARTLGFAKPDRKRVYHEVKTASAREMVVYEGVGGLRRESWTECRS